MFKRSFDKMRETRVYQFFENHKHSITGFFKQKIMDLIEMNGQENKYYDEYRKTLQIILFYLVQTKFEVQFIKILSSA